MERTTPRGYSLPTREVRSIQWIDPYLAVRENRSRFKARERHMARIQKLPDLCQRRRAGSAVTALGSRPLAE